MGVLLDGRAQPTGFVRRGSDRTLLLFFNAYHDVVSCRLLASSGGKGWHRLLDTNQPDALETDHFRFGHRYEVTGRSLVLFAMDPV